jgi:hypothetical protein
MIAMMTVAVLLVTLIAVGTLVLVFFHRLPPEPPPSTLPPAAKRALLEATHQDLLDRSVDLLGSISRLDPACPEYAACLATVDRALTQAERARRLRYGPTQPKEIS